MIARSISLVLAGSTETHEIVLDTHNVPDDVSIVKMTLTEEQMFAKLGELQKGLNEQVQAIALGLTEDAKAAGLGDQFVEYIVALESNPSLEIPKVFRGPLRKRIARFASLMRKSSTEPHSLVKGYLIGTEHGLVLNLWVYVESLTFYSDMVEAVNPQDLVSVEPLMLDTVAKLNKLTRITEELALDQVLENTKVNVIQPLEKPVVDRANDPGLDGDYLNTFALPKPLHAPELKKSSARCVTTALAQRFTRQF